MVLEVINGITFLTPLWLRKKPRVAMVHHVHRELFVGEYPRTGLLLYWILERLPLFLYRRTPFLTISRSAGTELARDGVPSENITVEYLGVEPGKFSPGTRSERPRLIFVGRLKAYKRVELLFDVLEAVPEAVLDVVGDGDHRRDLEGEIERRGLRDQVVMHGYVDEETKAELYGRAWVNMTASQSEGWSLTVMEAALCATPSAALAVGGLPSRSSTGRQGLLAHTPEELCDRARELVRDPELRSRLGDAAERRAHLHLGPLRRCVPRGAGARGRPRALGGSEPRTDGVTARRAARGGPLTPAVAESGLADALASVVGVEGWLSDDQARRLWRAANVVSAPGRVVEIGSFRGRSTIILRRAAAQGVEVVAIDPQGVGIVGRRRSSPMLSAAMRITERSCRTSSARVLHPASGTSAAYPRRP